MSFLRRAERVLFWVVCLAVLAACACFIFLVLTRPADAAEFLIPSPPPKEPEATVAAVTISVKPPVTVAPDSVWDRVAQAWPGDDRKVLCVVRKETGGTFDPRVRSRTGKYWGLFQADAQFRSEHGWKGWSVEQQTAMAWRGFRSRGWQPWPTARGC